MKIALEIPDEIAGILPEVIEETMAMIDSLPYDLYGGGWETIERAQLAGKARGWLFQEFERQIKASTSNTKNEISSCPPWHGHSVKTGF